MKKNFGSGLTSKRRAILSKPIILVSGARGKTGSHVVKRLLGKGLPVRGFAHRSEFDGRKTQI